MQTILSYLCITHLSAPVYSAIQEAMELVVLAEAATWKGSESKPSQADYSVDLDKITKDNGTW